MTPNTGYWMPDYAYYDFLEERGWRVDELRECEDWCYPFALCVYSSMEDNTGAGWRNMGCSVMGYYCDGCLDDEAVCLSSYEGYDVDWRLYD